MKAPFRFILLVYLGILLTSHAAPTDNVFDSTIRAIQEQVRKVDQDVLGVLSTMQQHKGKVQAAMGPVCQKLHCPHGSVSFRSTTLRVPCTCISIERVPYYLALERAENTGLASDKELTARIKRSLDRISKPPSADTNLTYVPPPRTDITDDLLRQSLTVQQQNTALIASINPRFQDGVISFGVQLDGLMATTLTLNASTSLPCGSIGTGVTPGLVLRPKAVVNATAKTILPDCQVIAVNMYSPLMVTYWVQKHDGGIYSLTGSNQVEMLDRINSTESAALIIRTQNSANPKRHLGSKANTKGKYVLQRAMDRRVIAPIDTHTAVMSAEACAAIKCINNGGKAALFNPFRSSCGCAEPLLAEIDRSS